MLVVPGRGVYNNQDSVIEWDSGARAVANGQAEMLTSDQARHLRQESGYG